MITTEQRVRITFNPLTPKGKPARIDGDIEYTSSDESKARIERIDGKSAYVVGVAANEDGTRAMVQINARCDADLDAGEERELTASGVLEVGEVEAASAEIVFGEPEGQP